GQGGTSPRHGIQGCVTMAGERETVTGKLGDRQAALWAALANNALALETAGARRAALLRARARLWDELAALSTPACGQAYRQAAAQCRAEADSQPRAARR